MSTAWKRKDLLTIRELERSEIELILDHARAFKDLLAKRVKKSTSLEGRCSARRSSRLLREVV